MLAMNINHSLIGQSTLKIETMTSKYSAPMWSPSTSSNAVESLRLKKLYYRRNNTFKIENKYECNRKILKITTPSLYKVSKFSYALDISKNEMAG